MGNIKTLLVTLGIATIATPAFAGTPTLAGAPTPAPAYKMENGVKVFQAMTMSPANHDYGREIRRIKPAHQAKPYQTTIENGVKVHRLMPATSSFSDPYGFGGSSSFQKQIKIIKKKAKKAEKRAYKDGYDDGFHDGYERAIENRRQYRRPIRLRQRIRTRPRVSRDVIRRRNLQ